MSSVIVLRPTSSEPQEKTGLTGRRSPEFVSTALSVEHWAELRNAFSHIHLASCLVQQPVADAPMHLRQRHPPAVGPRGKKAGACDHAGSPAALLATPAGPGNCRPASPPRCCGESRSTDAPGTGPS